MFQSTSTNPRIRRCMRTAAVLLIVTPYSLRTKSQGVSDSNPQNTTPSHQSGAAHSADIAVRLVYLKDGKPAQNQLLVLYEGNPSNASTMRTEGTTSVDGIARFHLSEPLPRTVWINTDNGRIRGCAWEDQILLADVSDHGVTIGVDGRFGGSCSGDRRATDRLGAKAGEIVMFVRKVSNWDNLRHY
jgi:hypothetical protein